MKQITFFLLVIFLFGTSFFSRSQQAVTKPSYHVTIVLSKNQPSLDLSVVQSAFQQADLPLTFDFQTRKNRSALTQKWTFPAVENRQYTRQQKALRDLDFPNGFPTDLQQLYIYCVPADTQQYFAIPHKSVSFVGVQHGVISSVTVQKALALQFGITGASVDSFFATQKWPSDELQKLKSNQLPFRFTDDYENIQTSNGRVAFYFWKENPDGTFLVDPENPMSQFVHPFKQNQFFVYLDVSNPFFKPRFHFLGYHVCLVHLLAVLFTLILQFFTFRKINKRMLDSRFFKRLSLRIAKLIIWGLAILSNVFAFYATEYYYLNYHMKFHEITSFHGKSQSELQHELEDINQFQTQASFFTKSQVFRQIDSSWYAQREDRVLYFDVDSNNHARFLHSRNILELKTIPYRRPTQSHFVVFRFFNGQNELVREKVFNHMGFDLTKKLLLPDPAKRILVFVNGYRPVSNNQSMSDFLNTFQEKGVEYPDTKNQLFSMDRYAYWEPWNQFNQLFQNRIQADEIWYADGHHSVATSNHRSVLQFAGNAAVYPKPCQSSRHHCYHTKLPSNQRVATSSLLATNPNYDGFNERFKHGKIAGNNLLQVLNEAPNYSLNDTIYIVSHSMGHAYAMGMSAALKGHVQFGVYYIIAPENAMGKTMDIRPWKQIWQYGSMRTGKFKQAPCLQDGVAAQSLVKGLAAKNHLTFPAKNTHQMGFFNSHFIGYYTWIFDIPQGKPGYVQQH
ncbi:MAG: hypothetical protein ACKOXP_06160 [Flavobacteriales bacterium]